jgi:hypothetical protein
VNKDRHPAAIPALADGTSAGRMTHDPTTPRTGIRAMPTYQMVYGDDEQVVRETYKDVEMVKEDGWVVLFRGLDAILRVQEQHVQSLEEIKET